MSEKQPKSKPKAFAARVGGPAMPLDIEHELQVLEDASKKICRSKESTLAFLIKAGFITEDHKLAERYR
jgi:hypothetical protein